MRYTIRSMKDEDILQAIEIDYEAFPTQWPHPTYSSFKHELRNRLAQYIVVAREQEMEPEAASGQRGNRSFWEGVLELKHLLDHDRFFGEEKPSPSKEHVVGIAGFWTMADEAHVTTIAVRDAYRRQGLGEWLLISIIDMAIQINSTLVTLEVRVSNGDAQALYEKYGFRRAGMRRGYYTDNGEDGLIMSTDGLNSPIFLSYFEKLKQIHRRRWTELYLV